MHVDFNKESLHKELETEIWLWLIRNSENIITGIIIIILLLLSLLRHCPGPAGGGADSPIPQLNWMIFGH